MIDTGNYVGYTCGSAGQKPTLYFEKGRYTQEHEDKSNEGWHPISAGQTCERINVSKKGMEVIMGISPEAREEEEDFANDVLRDAYPDDGRGALCEIFRKSSGEYVEIHVSRSRLIKEGDKDYTLVNTAEALETARNGVIAINELITKEVLVITNAHLQGWPATLTGVAAENPLSVMLDMLTQDAFTDVTTNGVAAVTYNGMNSPIAQVRAVALAVGDFNVQTR